MLRFVELAIEIFRAEGRQIGGRTLVRGVEVVKDELRAGGSEVVDDVVGRRKPGRKSRGSAVIPNRSCQPPATQS